MATTTFAQQVPEKSGDNNFSRAWSEVDSLMQIGQVQSAQTIVDKIYNDAHAQNDVPQYVKACLYRVALQNSYEEDAAVKTINELEAMITNASTPAKNILHSIAAEQYWNYYRQNRWFFHSRTATETTSDDINTWDLQKIVTKCVAHYFASLEDAAALQKSDIDLYKAFLDKQKDSEKYRPTLFDFLAFRAIEFYRDNEVDLVQPAARFSLTDAAYFTPAAVFSSMQISTPDSHSFKYQALVLLQKVIQFHLHDADPTALLDAELQRLDMVYNHIRLGENTTEKDSLYLAALQTLDSQYSSHPSSTEILFRIAKLYKQQGDAYRPFTNAAAQWKRRDAMKIIEEAIQRFPESFGAQNCEALKKEIERPLLTLVSDGAVLPEKPVLANLQYQNVKKAYYKIVSLDFKKTLETREDEGEIVDFYSKQKTIHAGEFALPNDGDYQAHRLEVALPALKAGYYAVLLSNDEAFSKESVVFSDNRIWVTNISYVTQPTRTNSDCDVMVLHRESGQPLSKVRVQTYTQEYNYDKRRYTVKFGDTLMTNAAGIVTLKNTASNRNRSINLLFTQGKDSYSTGDGNNIYLYRNNERNETNYSTTFFTDRAIYRPGQTVYFKGIVLQSDYNNPAKTNVVRNYRETLTFYNANYEKVSEMRVTTNEFGSFAGNFVIPATGLTGQMRIEGKHGSVWFNVEEYKRPKFEVTFNPIKGVYRLNEKVTVSGSAKAYAGSAVSEAKATYRVVREARYPYWRWWWGPMPYSSPQEITNGEMTTKDDGSFDIEFTALPDIAVAKKESPVFHYTVYAAVSDINGETHETQTSVPVGYQALLLATDAADKINANEQKTITIKAINLNGEAQPTQGTLTIWKLREPNRVLQNRRWERPDKFSMSRAEFEKLFPYSVYDNDDAVETWEKEKEVFTLSFDTQNAASYTLSGIDNWVAGKYWIELKANDAFGEPVENSAVITVFSDKQKTVPANEAAWFEVLTPSAQPGETVKVLVGSALRDVSVVFETAEDEKNSKRQTVKLNNEQRIIEIPVLEKYRGNFGVSMFFVKNNRSYRANQVIQVPYENKKLDIELSTFRDKLLPGQAEEWRVTIKDKKGVAVAAELLASMYDASLDAFAPHQWSFFPWRNNQIGRGWETETAFRYRQSRQSVNYSMLPMQQRYYDALISPDVFGAYAFKNPPGILFSRREAPAAQASMKQMAVMEMRDEFMVVEDAEADASYATNTTAAGMAGDMGGGVKTEEKQQQPQQPVQVRTNFNETAFFYPQLKTNENGETVISFTVPEALTRWKMQGLAWTTDLKVGSILKELVTQKDLMIFTNAPRFFHENDTIYFSAKLSNISDNALNVQTTVEFLNPLAGGAATLLVAGEQATKTTALAAGENKVVTWKLYIPEGLQAVTCRITATGGEVSDGEESIIPVLTNRMLVTESLPLPIRGNQTKQYEFTKLVNNKSTTLRNHSYAIEFTSNPAWNAVQALPYIMEYPYECAEQAFSRYYANSIATHIVNSDPKIKQVFNIWRNYQPTALQSNLEKNEELKMLLLEETPWVRDAQNESERKQRIAVLFDLNRMSNELSSALRKVERAQTSNGGFAWFRGGPDSRYITQHIVAGFGQLKKMNISTGETANLLRKALRYMDDKLAEEFTELKKQAEKNKTDYKKENQLSYMAIHYLYARSFFVKDFPIPQTAKEAHEFYQTQAATYWGQNNNYLKGMLALALYRFGDTKTAQLIMKSLSETALHSEEMGMYWRSNAPSWWWYEAPIETQALMIEAFHEILNDQKSVDELKVWLLKQKQTTDWKTTKATANAVYALLGTSNATGSSLLSNDKLAEITVNGQTIDPHKLEGGNRPEAGTGYFKTSWKGGDVQPGMGNITVTNPNPTIAWGAAYWQYFEQLDKITPAATGVQIKKQLFVKTNSPAGLLLKEIKPTAPIKVGDKITVRIEIRADRDMEYVHLKDMRAAAFEPLNVLSGYRWQGGLGYYESTHDAATNFFISYLPKGTYVFEYDVFATQAGEFSNGITSLQCMYAPEFTTHSEGIRVRVSD